MAVVYLHRRKDTNEIFYVGIGKRKNRAYVCAKRNPHWKAIVDKHGHTVEIAFKGLSYDDALTIEQEMIQFIGRSDKGLGPLTNMTDGGEGTLGFEPWNKNVPMKESSKKKCSVSIKTKWNDPEYRAKCEGPREPHTQEWKDHMSKVMKEIGNKPPQNQAEREWTQSSREKVRNNQTGESNSCAVLTEEKVRYIKKNYKAYHKEYGASALARKFGCATTTISSVIRGTNWGWVVV